jgi:hypothetical protein
VTARADRPQTEGVSLFVGYDGPATATGRMDVQALAPAMASVAKLVDDATRIIHGTDAALRVEVSGDFRRGSFTYQLVTTAVSQLTPEQIRQTLEWLGLIATVSGVSVIGVLKWLGGRKVDQVARVGDDVRLTAGDQSQIVNFHVAQLVMNYGIRSDFEGVTKPLENPGIAVLRTGEANSPAAAEITQDELPAFVAPSPAAEKLHDQPSEAILQLVTPNLYRAGNKWQFAYPGEAPFFAPVLDRDFLRRFQRREVVFGYGDLVRVRLRTTVSRTEVGTLSTSREVLEVLEVLPPAKQTDLFAGDL